MNSTECAKVVSEVGSDIFGMASALALVVPVYRGIRERKKLADAREAVLGSKIVNIDDALKTLQVENSRLAEYDEREGRWLKVGLWLLAGSFALRLMFHALKHWAP